MSYTTSLDFRGDVRKALEVGRGLLVALDFEVSSVEAGRVVATRKVFRIVSDNAVRIASCIVLTSSASLLTAEADLSGLKRALTRAVALLSVAEVVKFVLLAKIIDTTDALSSLLTVPLWFVIFPILWKVLRREVARAVDTLLANVAAAA
jgi:hypothetical protein